MEQIQVIQSKIYEIRGQKVMLDRDLAEMYEVQTKALNQAVKRNIDRFPEDFMFQLTNEETQKRLCQNAGTPSFYAQSPDFLKPGLCYYPKFL